MLRDRVRRFLATSLREVERHDELGNVAEAIRAAQLSLDEPMRVAVAGRIKRGKSTLVNALLGEELVATGTLEMTYNVNEMYWSDTSSDITVHFKDGTAPQRLPLAELSDVTARSEDAAKLAYLTNIARIEVPHPAELLRSFRILDTPGLDSAYETDAANTLAALGLSSGEAQALGLSESAAETLRNDTVSASAASIEQADALIYLIARAQGATDANVLEFDHPALRLATPAKAIGVMSRADAFWPASPGRPGADEPLTFDPLDDAREIGDKTLANEQVGRRMFRMLPVCGKLGMGAQALTPDEFEAIGALTAVGPGDLYDLLRSVKVFQDDRGGLTAITPEARSALLGRLDLYGVHLATMLARDRPTYDELTAELFQRSGVADLRRLITDHFGNRAYTIKLDQALNSVERAIADARTVNLEPAAAERLRGLSVELGRLKGSESSFVELDALKRHYAAIADPNAPRTECEVLCSWEAELLAITGENGPQCADRLGLDRATPVEEQLATATERLERWRRRAQGVGLGPETDRTIQHFVRAYELLCYHLARAVAHLNHDDHE